MQRSLTNHSAILLAAILVAGCGAQPELAKQAQPADSPPTDSQPAKDGDGETPPGTATAAETQAIAEEAFIYGFPLVMNYAVMNDYFINKSSGEYKCGFNELYNTARVYTPNDTAVVTPNSDTPYSFFCADLRAEPVVVTVPEIEKDRYYSVQLVDMYTFNYGYIGSRATGNGAGKFMIAGPGWKGETPEGIKQVFSCETEFTLAIIRTQLFDPADLEKVKQVQTGYALQTLSEYQGKPQRNTAPEINWPKIDKQSAQEDPFAYLSFVLQFCPPTGPAAMEDALRAKFARIGIEAGKSFEADRLSEEQKVAIKAGMQAGYQKIAARAQQIGKNVNGWLIGSAFGNRDFFQGDWTLRAAAAKAGIYGNNAVEATYPLAHNDGDGDALDGSQHNYTLTFAAGELPPVNAFWSVTMYDGKTQLLIENPINRYLINSPMLPAMKKNEDGSLTIYIQKGSPGEDKESNWLPAPDGPIYMAMRLYWPKEKAPSVLPPGEGSWKPPAIMKAK